jgi:hypothetical protein
MFRNIAPRVELAMKLREDSDPYCGLWIGMLLLGAYYFNFFYFSVEILQAFPAQSMVLMILPILQVFFFIGYLKPDRGRAKATMLAIAVSLSIILAVFTLAIPEQYNGGFYLAVWATGAALIVAGGFSIMHPIDEASTPGILDVSSLHYGPPPDEEEEVVEAEEPETPEPESPATPEAS